VIVNGLNILELDRDQLLPGAERTAEYLPNNGPDHRPLSANGESAGVPAEQTAATSSSVLTFPSRAAFLGLPQMRAYLDLSLRLAFRTRESTGLLLYNAGRRSDFLALELADGHLHLVASIGGRIVELKDNYPEGVNDNQWHVLVVARTGKDGQCALTTFPPRSFQPFFLSSSPYTFHPHRYPTNIPNHLFFFFVYFFGGLEFVGHSLAYVAYFVFLRDVWILTQRAAVAGRRANNLATHLRACKKMGG
jgi:hypothetical protein